MKWPDVLGPSVVIPVSALVRPDGVEFVIDLREGWPGPDLVALRVFERDPRYNRSRWAEDLN